MQETKDTKLGKRIKFIHKFFREIRKENSVNNKSGNKPIEV